MRLCNDIQDRQWVLFTMFLVLQCGSVWSAEKPITQEYWLKSTDVSYMTQALNIVIRNPTGKRIMGGQGKHLVITDAEEQQNQIAEILPIMDQPTTETKPHRIVMEMVGRAGVYMHNNQKAVVLARKNEAPPGAPVPAPIFVSGVNSYDAFKSTRSVYAAEDAKLLKQPRRIVDEPVLPLFSDLILKGIFEPEKGKRIALLSAGGMLYTARDGGLFESNRSRLKEVTSQVLTDHVILVGPDRIPRKITFKSTL